LDLIHFVSNDLTVSGDDPVGVLGSWP